MEKINCIQEGIEKGFIKEVDSLNGEWKAFKCINPFIIKWGKYEIDYQEGDILEPKTRTEFGEKREKERNFLNCLNFLKEEYLRENK